MSPQERDGEIDRLETRTLDHDRRILTLETYAKVTDAELASLRASRHEHGNWLNRHNLEVSELNMKVMAMTTQVAAILVKAEAMEKNFNNLTLNLAQQIAQMKSDLRQTMWIVSLIVGIIVFVGRSIAIKYGF